jgi:glutamine synthetase adenylyltransferase
VYRNAPDGSPSRLSGDGERAAYEIEMLTQVCQLAHGARHAGLRQAGTLGALEVLAAAGLIPEPICRELDRAYVFLRTAEHRRQLGLGDSDVDKQVRASRERVKEICAAIEGALQ